MKYTVARAFDGDMAKAMEIASTAFSSNNFDVTHRTPTSIEFEARKGGPRAAANSPLLGATRIKLDMADGQLRLMASLRGVWAMGRLLIYLPVALGIILIVLLGLLFRDNGLMITTFIAIALVLPWVVLAPFMVRWLKGRAIMVLANLLQSIIDRTLAP